tara:strand:- start:135 stop:488 length:354 start_codon:yes stop_codon:yes gene_type:complete
MLSDLFDTTIKSQILMHITVDSNLPPVAVDNFEGLISMGELVDRLTIVNIKLYNLKNEVMDSKDQTFRSWAAEQDVYLVEERARLKKCIDEKLKAEIKRFVETGESGYNPEVKKYGG